MGGVIRDFNKYRNIIEGFYNYDRNIDGNGDDFSQKDRNESEAILRKRFQEIRDGNSGMNSQDAIDRIRINFYQRVGKDVLGPELEQYRAFLRNFTESGSHALNQKDSPLLEDQNYAGGYRTALSRTSNDVKNFFTIQNNQDGIGQTFNVKDNDLVRSAERELQQVMSFGGNSSQQGQRLAQAFYANYDSSGMPTMRLQEMIAAMNYSQTLGDGKREQFKAGFFKGMANFIKQNRGFTPVQFMNTMANVYNNLDWGGADVNGKDETSRNLGQLQGFLGELVGGVAKEFGFKKGIIGGYDDGVRGATALVLGDDGKAEFQTVREGSVLTKSRLLWEGDGSSVALTAADNVPANGQGGGTNSVADLQKSLAEATKLVNDPNSKPEDMLKVLNSLTQSMSAALSGVNLGDPKAIQSAIELLEGQVAGLDEKNPARALLTTQIDGLKALLADKTSEVKPASATPPPAPKPFEWRPKDLNEAKENPNKFGTRLFVEDENYNPTKEDSNFARQNPDTLFALGVAFNPNYTPTQEDIEVARKNPDARFASIVGNSNYTPTQEDMGVARKNPDSWLALVLSDNANNINYTPTQEDIEVAKKNPDTYFARIVAEREKALAKSSN